MWVLSSGSIRNIAFPKAYPTIASIIVDPRFVGSSPWFSMFTSGFLWDLFKSDPYDFVLLCNVFAPFGAQWCPADTIIFSSLAAVRVISFPSGKLFGLWGIPGYVG